MQLLSWHGVEVAGVVLTGRMAGYLMALAGRWAGAIPALMAFDLAAFGRHSLVSDCPSAWLLVGLCIPSAEQSLVMRCAVGWIGSTLSAWS